MAQGNPLDDAIKKVDELLAILSAAPGGGKACPSTGDTHTPDSAVHTEQVV